MKCWSAVVLLVACHGGSAPPKPPEAPAAPPVATPPPPPKQAELAPEAACARFDALAGEGCAWANRFPPAMRDAKTCVTSLSQWLSPQTADHDQLQKVVSCWALDCDAAADCMVNIQANAAPPPPRSCGDQGTAPILVDAATWAARRGAAAKRFADVHTTVEAPIEVCGIDGELAWMTRAACNDGSHPYATQAAAHDARDSWLERGGRCNSILDRYTVRCPEATYQIHVDRYVCEKP